jgi:hypothetical protein
MRPWYPLLALFALAGPLPAADPPAAEVPKTWEKLHAVADADKLGAGVLLTTGDSTVWVEKVLVESTKQFRAQSFTETVYRLKTGDQEPEKLEQVVTTHGLYPLVGPKGEVANGSFADCRTLYLPGLKPIPMPKGDVRFAAHEWAADGLVCTAERYVVKDRRYEVAVQRWPIDKDKNALGEPTTLRPWAAQSDDGFKPDNTHGRVFARGRFVVCTGTVPDAARPGFPLRATEVWDTKGDKAVWTARVTAEGADDTHAYWAPEAGVVARRALDGTGAAEQLAIPKDAVRLDFRPPHLFALVKQEKDWVLTRFDLGTGDRVEYDLRLAGDKPGVTVSNSGPTRFVTAWADGRKEVTRFGLDAAGGEVRAVRDRTLYRIPPGKKVAADAKPKWEPLPDPK